VERRIVETERLDSLCIVRSREEEIERKATGEGGGERGGVNGHCF
jgi:hypothetical protein